MLLKYVLSVNTNAQIYVNIYCLTRVTRMSLWIRWDFQTRSESNLKCEDWGVNRCWSHTSTQLRRKSASLPELFITTAQCEGWGGRGVCVCERESLSVCGQGYAFKCLAVFGGWYVQYVCLWVSMKTDKPGDQIYSVNISGLSLFSSLH